MLAWIRRLLKPRSGWYIITPMGNMGPFRTEQEARNYPNTFRGFIDAPMFRCGYRVIYWEAE